ncbi:MAG: tetratricopeptide repeat protein [Nitrospirae bacterium]|nr:tetratricopeptide repeat protein [Nitrospirota bacterium]
MLGVPLSAADSGPDRPFQRPPPSTVASQPLPRQIDSPLDQNEAERQFEEGLRHAFGHDLAQAVGAFHTAIALNPTNPFFHYNLGLVYGMQHRLDSAMAEMRTTVSLKPNFTPAHFRLGFLLELTDRYDEALREYTLAMAGADSGWEHAAARQRLDHVRDVLRAKQDVPSPQPLDP